MLALALALTLALAVVLAFALALAGGRSGRRGAPPCGVSQNQKHGCRTGSEKNNLRVLFLCCVFICVVLFCFGTSEAKEDSV